MGYWANLKFAEPDLCCLAWPDWLVITDDDDDGDDVDDGDSDDDEDEKLFHNQR